MRSVVGDDCSNAAVNHSINCILMSSTTTYTSSYCRYEVELPVAVCASMYSMRATASAACHTNAPNSWVLQGHKLSVDEHQREFQATLESSLQTVAENDGGTAACEDAETDTRGWVTLHRVEGGVGVEDGKPGHTDGPEGDGRSTGWTYDTSFKPGEIPGECR